MDSLLRRAAGPSRRTLLVDAQPGHYRAQTRRGGARPTAAAGEGSARGSGNGEPDEGRVPRHHLARTADAVDGDPGLDQHAQPRVALRLSDAAGAAGDRAE